MVAAASTHLMSLTVPCRFPYLGRGLCWRPLSHACGSPALSVRDGIVRLCTPHYLQHRSTHGCAV